VNWRNSVGGEAAKIPHEHWEFEMMDRVVHNLRVTGLWTGCTRLMNKKLKAREFD
jgi:hypothetical protein